MAAASSGLTTALLSSIVLLLSGCFVLNVAGNEAEGRSLRVRRQTVPHERQTSLLTVQWEGLDRELADTSKIAGFVVEYRKQHEQHWTQHNEIVPYGGRRKKEYKVKIKNIPSGLLYYVRIKVVDKFHNVLFKTPEIVAESEKVKFSCEGNRLDPPRNLQVDSQGRYSLSFSWNEPQCVGGVGNSVREYQLEVYAVSGYARFDLHRQTVPARQRSATVANLLPGTQYRVRVRAVDAKRQLGPWTESQVERHTKGKAPTVASDIRGIYRTDRQIRVEWKPYLDRQLQHYEVMILERAASGEGLQLYRARVAPTETSYVFDNLKPGRNYVVGVIAFVNSEPRQVYKVELQTARTAVQSFEMGPNVDKTGAGQSTVHWVAPRQLLNRRDVKAFVIEYKLPNETIWRRYGNEVTFTPGQANYKVDIGGLSNRLFYTIRVYIVNQGGEVVGQTSEFKAGSAAGDSCSGLAGVPTNVRIISADKGTITYKWDRPRCDESFGPIEGYDYMHWEMSETHGKPQPRPMYVAESRAVVRSLKANGGHYGFRVRSRFRGGQSPWSQIATATTAAAASSDYGNIYRLHVEQSASKLYLVWTPLPEHSGRIRQFKLSYKISSAGDWTTIAKTPDQFEQCRKDAKEPLVDIGDFCHDISVLRQGVQYTAKLVYLLDNGQWSKEGDPLLFKLVGTDRPTVDLLTPSRLRVSSQTQTRALINWFPPVAAAHYKNYIISVVVMNSTNPYARIGHSDRLELPANAFFHELEGLLPDTVYNISVSAVTRDGDRRPAAHRIFSSTKDAASGNIYNLRVVLAPPRSYVVWTPLPEHRGQIQVFKFSYKISLATTWTRVEDKPSRFDCPVGIGNEGDYCYDISRLRLGIQYTSDLIYRLNTGKWTKHGNPLFFIRVKAEDQEFPSKPKRLQVRMQPPSSALINWLPPLSTVKIVRYKVTVTIVSSTNPHGRAGHSSTVDLPGNIFTHQYDNLLPDTVYNISVQAGTENFLGPAAHQTISLGKGRGLTIEQPQIQQRGGSVFVTWNVMGGDLSKLCCYQIDMRSDSDREWKVYGSLIRQSGRKRQYSQAMEGLSGNLRYLIRIRALDRSRQTRATSDPVSVKTQCQAPQQPPADLRIIPDASGGRVRLVWTPPPRATWGCAELFYLLEGTVNGRPMQQRVSSNPRAFTVEHRIDADAGSEVRVMVRSANSGGVSEPSKAVTAKLEQEALVSAPRVSVEGGSNLKVEWQSQGTGRGVYGYRVMYRNPAGRWAAYGQIVPYEGDNRQYQNTLRSLPVGEMYYVKIDVLDRNQYVMYSSSETSARTQCNAPTQPPINVQVSAPDPGHVRVSWTIPAISTWGCGDATVELQVVEPNRAQPPLQLDVRQTQHVFESRPNQQWAVRLRMKSSGGESPWSRTISTKTPPAGELIIGPTVGHRGRTPVLSWKSITGVDDLVAHYVVEYMSPSRPRWQPHGNKVPYAGHQRPYTVELDGLPEGETSQLRVKVVDYNNGIAYTSPAVPVQVRGRCQPPRNHPAQLSAIPVGPTQIRVQWRPLARSDWNCDQLWYILKYSSPSAQGVKNFTSTDSSTTFESTPHSSWRFQIRAENPVGASPWSTPPVTTQTLTTAPGPVTNLQATVTGSDNARISWGQPVDPNGIVTGYDITYQLLSRGLCQDSTEQPVTQQKPAVTAFIMQGLYPHSRYKITVAARNPAVGQAISQEFTTEAAVPSGPPRGLQARATSGTRVTLNWQAPTCLDSNGQISEYEYELIGADDWVRGERKQQLTRSTSADVDGLTPYTNYRAKVRAYTKRGPGPWSAPITVRTEAADQPNQVQVLKVIDTGPDFVQLQWQSPYPPHGVIDKYVIRYSIGGMGNWKEVELPAEACRQGYTSSGLKAPHGASVHCTILKPLQPEQLYDFQVAGHIYGKQKGPWSRTESARTGGGPVSVLSVDSTSRQDTSIDITWTVRPSDKPRVQAFRIIVYPVTDNSRVQQYQVDGSTYTYRLENLEANTRYNVTVQAKSQSGYHRGFSQIFSTDDTPLAKVLSPPRITKQGAKNIDFEWNAPSNTRAIKEYIVEYRTTGAWQRHDRRVSSRPGQSLFRSSIEDLPSNTKVQIRIRAVNRNGQMGEPSPEATGQTGCTAPKLPPQGIRVDAPENLVRVVWSRPAKNSWSCDHLGVVIWSGIDEQSERFGRYKEKHGSHVEVPISSDQTEYTWTSKPHTEWEVKMKSTNQMGDSPWSTVYPITTQQGAPGVVRNLVLTPLSPNEVRVAWLEPIDKQGVIVGYDVSYRLKHRLACADEEPRDVSRAWVTVYNVKDLDYTLTGLLPFSKYEVKVRARTTKRGPEATKEVSTKMTQPSAPPLDLRLTYTLERSFNFAWEPVECSQRHGHITNYEYEIIGQDDWAKLERQISNTSDVEIDVSGLTPFTKYIMRVKAYNSIGGGPNSESLDAMTAKADAPLPPQDLSIKQEGTEAFEVTWLPPYPPYGPIVAYKIQYQKINDNVDEWTTVDTPADDRRIRCDGENTARLCFNVTGLQPAQSYKLKVAAKIEAGQYGQYASAVYPRTLEIIPDAPIRIDLIGKTDTTIEIAWVPPSDPMNSITQYKLVAKNLDKPDTEPKYFMVKVPTTQYLIEGLTPETEYNVSIQAGTKRGFGEAIWTRVTTEPFMLPLVGKAPVLTADGADKMNVEWSGVFDPKLRIKGYIIEFRRSDDPAWQEHEGVIAHNTIKRTYLEKLTRLDADTIYVVRIKVVDKKDRVSKAGPQAEARTGCSPPRSPPINLRMEAPSARQVAVYWQAPNADTWLCSVIKYRMEFRNGSEGTLKEMELPSSSNQYTFDSLPYTKWTVRLRTENEAGESEWTDQVEVKTPEDAPGEIGNLIGLPKGPTTIKVTWEEPDDPNGVIRGYTLVYQLKSKGACPVPPGSPMQKEVRSVEWMLKDLEPASTYEIYVIPKTIKDGPKSRVITATTEEAKPSTAPIELRSTSLSQNHAGFSWQQLACEGRNGRITGYKYELEPLDDWVVDTTTKTDSTSGERAELSDLTPYTRYRFRVRATNSKGDGPFGDWLEVQTAQGAPPAPTGLEADKVFPQAIRISFLPPRPPHGVIDEYRIRSTPANRINWVEVRASPDNLDCADARDRLCYRVVNLEPKEKYLIQVAAHTTDWGDWTNSLEVETVGEEIVPEQPLRVTETTMDSLTVQWEGLDTRQYKSIIGYVLEYSKGRGSDFVRWNGILEAKPGPRELHQERISSLQSDTEYFLRLRVATKGNQISMAGPQVKAKTSCGAPLEYPQEIRLTPQGFEGMKIEWTPPDQSTWRCGDVRYLLQYRNNTAEGQLELPSDRTEHLFQTEPGTTWIVKMRTVATEGGQAGRMSEWSPERRRVTPGPPNQIYLNVRPTGPDSGRVVWGLPDGDEDWRHGVDITYRLVQMGACGLTEEHKPVTLYNQQEKSIDISKLHPWSVYEVTVTPRTPQHLSGSSNARTQTKKQFQTHELAPSSPPENIRVSDASETQLMFKWDPPRCDGRHGEITQYQYEFRGVDKWVEDVHEDKVDTRTSANLENLTPGTRYRIRIKAYTAEGSGPFSEWFPYTTPGSEIGAPRHLTIERTMAHSATFHWLPPYPVRGPVRAYKMRYAPEKEGSAASGEPILGLDQLRCEQYIRSTWTFKPKPEHLCYKIVGLKNATVYKVAVQAQSETGKWGEWSRDVYPTTPGSDSNDTGGTLKLIAAGHDYLKVRWNPPTVIGNRLTSYRLGISVATDKFKQPVHNFTVGSKERTFKFRNLEKTTKYNVTVDGFEQNDQLWRIPGVFSTTDKSTDPLYWLGEPRNLRLLFKTQTVQEIAWDPPEVLKEEYRYLITRYVVTYAEFHPDTRRSDHPPKTYTIGSEHTDIRIPDLKAGTIYNITVRAATETDVGPELWGAYSTLDPGADHKLRLINRTPTTLNVGWDPRWGTKHRGYVLTAVPQASVDEKFDLRKVKRVEVGAEEIDYVLDNLHPNTIYNVTLELKGREDGAWGAYATLPPGSWVVNNLHVCQSTNFGVSISFDPIDHAEHLDYRVRYRRIDNDWGEAEESKPEAYLRCPGDPCDKLCYLVYNIKEAIDDYQFQVQAYVAGEWNKWKTVSKDSSPEFNQKCCIVPPPYMVDLNIPDTRWIIDINPSPDDTYVLRYKVWVDERDPPEVPDYNKLFDKVTAKKYNLPYYVTASFDRRTLTQPRKLTIGDGTVHGGYLNYPLEPGKKYNWGFATTWMMDGKVGYGMYQDSRHVLAGWPWWWLLLLLLLLLLLILLCCCLLWCLGGRYRRRRDYSRIVVNGHTQPLLVDGKEKDENLAANLRALEGRIEGMRSALDSRLTGQAVTLERRSRDGDLDSEADYDFQQRIRRKREANELKSELRAFYMNGGKGEFEDGYVKGFKDASKVTSSGAARRKMDEDYGGKGDGFHTGYVQGLRDAGMTGMTTSMHNLAQKSSGSASGGYSAGYMQGFRDGNSGIFGDRITTTLLKRLEEQYPAQDEFRQGYIDGFKEGGGNRTRDTFQQSSKLEESLTHISDRLNTLEKTKAVGGGDDLHSTKIYHVYNQMEGTGGGVYQASGQQLAQELEELSSSSRRSTLRKHYTPGDYLKYGSELDYGSLRPQRRSLSATALGRDSYQAHHQSSRTSKQTSNRQVGGTRGAVPPPVAIRPPPPSRLPPSTTTVAAPSSSTTVSSSASAAAAAVAAAAPATMTAEGAESSLAQVYNLVGERPPDVDTTTGPIGGGDSSGSERDLAAISSTSRSFHHHRHHQASVGGAGGTSGGRPTGDWTDELQEIVREPMEHTLDRMKKYSTSLSQMNEIDQPSSSTRRHEVEPLLHGGSGVKESVNQSYSQSYKQEYTMGGH